MANIKKGDLVQLITGRSQARGGDRGKQGRVIEVLVERNRVVVEGLNYITKHVRVGQSDRGTKTGGIETREAPIHVSNVQLVNPDTKQPARVGFTVETNAAGKTTRTRYFKVSRRVPVKKVAASKAESTKSTKAESTKAETAETVELTDEAPKAEAAPKAKAAAKTTKATEKDAE